MSLNKKIRQLNDVFGASLGRNRFGDSLYAWLYSETTMHQYLASIPDKNGNQQLDMHERPSGLLVCEWQVKTRKLCPELHDQWFVALWADGGSEYDWQRKFGDKLPWPSRGYHSPTNVWLNAGELPDTAVTEEIIGMIRKERQLTRADYIHEAEDAFALEEKQNSALLNDMIADACTAFGNPKPGCRGNGISLPFVEKRA